MALTITHKKNPPKPNQHQKKPFNWNTIFSWNAGLVTPFLSLLGKLGKML